MHNDCSIVERDRPKRFLEEIQYKEIANSLEYELYSFLETFSIVCDYPKVWEHLSRDFWNYAQYRTKRLGANQVSLVTRLVVFVQGF